VARGCRQPVGCERLCRGVGPRRRFHVVPQDGYDLRLAATTDSRWTHPRRLTVASGAGTRRRANEAQASHAHRSRDRLTVATGAGARRRAKESGACALSRGSASQAVETTGLHDRRRPARSPVGTRRGAPRASRMQDRYDIRSAHRTRTVRRGRPPRRRGVQTRVAARLARVGRGRGSIPRLAGGGLVRGLGRASSHNIHCRGWAPRSARRRGWAPRDQLPCDCERTQSHDKRALLSLACAAWSCTVLAVVQSVLAM
jgi:hypothetical protein